MAAHSAAPIKTWLTETLGIKYPITMGGMMWVGRAELAAAVSNAGGLGTITALTQPSPEALREEIRKMRRLTDKPFAVNITLLPSIRPPNYREYCEVALAEGVRIFETAGNPYTILDLLQKSNAIVIHKCVSIRHALKAQSLGVHCISMDGFECAGHPGEDDIPGLVLLAKAAKALKIPYIASGGFADGRGLAAALALGAQGVNMGTRIMCTVESAIHPNIKQALVDGDEHNTVLMLRSFKNTTRMFKNDVSTEVVRIERERGKPDFSEVQELVSGARGRTVYETGDKNGGVWTAGMVQGLIDDVPTCEVLLRRVADEAASIVTGVAAKVSPRAKL
ncbi:uncharacterized protein V1510DRAFT_415797 [Dipodascopsis tothii]|uniref:uncharacterized protein n=1 Tax=Dipodascopsis tothii TaxID=44089 RepID=UPI0034CD5B74